MTKTTVTTYLNLINDAIENIRITNSKRRKLDIASAFDVIIKKFKAAGVKNKKLIFIGNGGSASVSGHMSENCTKVGKIRAINFNDGPFLTCLSNDYSFEQVFEKAIEFHADKDDILIAISSSGNSMNIRNGVLAAKKKKCFTITLSGFKPNNPLSKMADINIYAPTNNYGVTEITHEAILHYLLDRIAS
jgi:D-sedoheptulose 7-phosphate isomerase